MQLFHLLFALLVTLIWGFTFVVVKEGLKEIPPLLLGSARFFLTSIPAIFFIKWPKAPLKMVIGYGLVMFALQFSLLFMGMYAGITAGLAALLLQFQLFFTILLAMLFFRERLRSWQVIGGLLSFTGIALVAINVYEDATFLGFVLVLAAAASWGIGNIISKKMGKVNMISLVVWGSLIAWPPLLTLSLLTEGADKILYTLKNLDWLAVTAVFYITYCATLISFSIWSWLLHHYPLGTIAPFSLLTPIIGILSSALVLREPLQSWKIGAASLVIAGLCVNLLGPRIFANRTKK
jgi:O-acetylserine/cysteine efflux transporter